MNVLYLSTRVRFNWDEVDFSLFSTYSMITNLVGKRIPYMHDVYTYLCNYVIIYAYM